MKAMILAAGEGTRMGALTRDTPKALLPVAGTPMIQYAVDNLKKAGVTELVINTHYKADQIHRFIDEQNEFGIKVSVSHEVDLLDTGGGILNARPWLDGGESFLVHNADVYSEIDLQQLVREHVAAKAIGTLAIKRRNTSRGLLFSDAGVLCGWENTDKNQRVLVEGVDPHAPMHSFGFCGVHILSPGIFTYLEAQGAARFSIIDAYLAAVGNGALICGFDIGAGTWFDIGTQEKLAVVEQYLKTRK